MDGHDPAEDHWWCPDDHGYSAEDAAVAVAAADADDKFLHMFGNSNEDLFKLVWEGDSTGTGEPAVSCIRWLPPRATAHIVPAPDLAPSEDVMAEWLYPIVSGADQPGDSSNVPAKVKSDYKGKVPAATDQDMSGAKNTNTCEKGKLASGGSSRTSSSHHYGKHNTTERRRRCRISDRLRTLQQLVPGCDNSNQASTLEQTIQYMKSLQQQVQSMNTRPAASEAAAATYTLLQPPPLIPGTPTGQVRPGTVIPMVPYGAMMHYLGVMMPAAPVG